MAKPPKSDVIQTSRLPAICPACADRAPAVHFGADGVYRVRCERCGWAAKYALVVPA